MERRSCLRSRRWRIAFGGLILAFASGGLAYHRCNDRFGPGEAVRRVIATCREANPRFRVEDWDFQAVPGRKKGPDGPHGCLVFLDRKPLELPIAKGRLRVYVDRGGYFVTPGSVELASTKNGFFERWEPEPEGRDWGLEISLLFQRLRRM